MRNYGFSRYHCLFLPRTGLFNIYFKKFDVFFFFCFFSSKNRSKLYHVSLRRLPSQHGDISVMCLGNTYSRREIIYTVQHLFRVLLENHCLLIDSITVC